MSARRPIPSPSEKPLSASQGGEPSSIVSDTSPAVPRDVIYKLLGFTFAMAVVPIGSYFFTLKTVFNGNATYSGAFAAIMANVVLISYIIVAMREEDDTKGPTGKIEVGGEGKKGR